MSEMELIIIRHGETAWNRERVFRGMRDIRLSQQGIAQADATAAALKDKVFDAIYSSPLKRSLVTARRIAKPHEIAVRETIGFADISYGSWEGLQEDTVASQYSKLLEKWKESPAKVKFPNGESIKKAWKRVNSSLREIIWTHGTGTVVIVSHRIPVKLMTAYLSGRKRDAIGEYRHDPCAISVFKVVHRDYKVVKLNDSSHLERLGLPPPEDF
ncbi:MAG: histidine phosphatase family protein [Methanobacteriota archaeon]|nr:MAG: histidine phosphatase family protein [Euryarchaeota archaeon]